jgi:CDP-6-deoxy-D-xylo-4-hexulose-3-dehydrase
MNDERRAALRRLIAQELDGLPVERHDPAEGLPLQVTGFGAEEASAVMEVLLSTWVTMGRETQAFEEEWAAWCGASHGVMVNSGSSANLIALAALVHTGRLRPGDEVLVPAVSWSTSLFPVAQVGLVPVMVDVDPDSLCVSPEIARAAMGPRTRGVVAVHLLGHVVDVPAMKELGLTVLEDACGAHGAEWQGRRVGAIGDIGTFSFFFSHHITTVEGGIVVTDDDDLVDAARALRAHGWIRERSDKAEIAARHPEMDDRFLFVAPGYNLRPTEMAAAMGRVQLKRLDAWNDRRRENLRRWSELLEGVPFVRAYPELPGTRNAAFAFSISLTPDAPFSRRALQDFLESRGIVTRPISGSNLARQPAARHVPGLRIAGPLTVADAIHERGLFVGNSQAFHEGHGLLLAETIKEFVHGL